MYTRAGSSPAQERTRCDLRQPGCLQQRRAQRVQTRARRSRRLNRRRRRAPSRQRRPPHGPPAAARRHWHQVRLVGHQQHRGPRRRLGSSALASLGQCKWSCSSAPAAGLACDTARSHACNTRGVDRCACRGCSWGSSSAAAADVACGAAEMQGAACPGRHSAHGGPGSVSRAPEALGRQGIFCSPSRLPARTRLLACDHLPTNARQRRCREYFVMQTGCTPRLRSSATHSKPKAPGQQMVRWHKVLCQVLFWP